MTTEEKAKAYDDALKRASHVKGYKTLTPQEAAEYIFPQLHESEDEKTRKRLIDFISNIKTISESGRNSLAIRKDDAEMCDAFLLYLEKKKDHFRDDTKMVEKQDYSGLNDLERAIHRGFLSAGVENVPVTIIKETANECKRTQTIANENANAEWSEKDENIRKQLISICNEWLDGGYSARPCLNNVRWLKNLLEKQKEQKPALKQTLDAYKISDERATAKMKGRIEGRQDVINNPEEYGLQKPAEWSEEDERILYNVIAYVGYAAGERGVKDDDFKEANEWLRNLRSHLSWKPSEEQMNCLCAAVDAAIRKHNESVSGYKPARVLKSLYEQLQRLM